MEKYEKVPLKELLEAIQLNLGLNIDSIYKDAIDGIYTSVVVDTEEAEIKNQKERNLTWKKRILKEQIEKYLKTMVKNIIYHIRENPNGTSRYMLGSDTVEMLNSTIKDKEEK